ELRAERAAVPACELVGDHPPDVVPRPLVLAAGIAEARDEQIERRSGLAATQQAHRRALAGSRAGLARGLAARLGRSLGGALGSLRGRRCLFALRDLLALLDLLLGLDDLSRKRHVREHGSFG